MNRMLKIGVAAIALTAVVPAFAEENETPAGGPVGWTPIALGLATPVQLPWGLDRWDVYGIDLNLIYADAPRMYGIGVGGLVMRTRDELMGLQVSGLWNHGASDVYGLRASLGLNSCAKTVYGVDLGMVEVCDKVCGFNANLLGSGTRNLCGVQASGLLNLTQIESCGVTIAGLSNIAKTASGLQVAIFYNMTDELHGCQVGFVNYADYCPNGFQIGLVNIILSNRIKVLPFVNGYF